MTAFPEMRRLHNRGLFSRGLVVDRDGVMLGSDCVLVRRTSTDYQAANSNDLKTVFRFAFGEGYDSDSIIARLEKIAGALNDDNILKAQILGLQIPVDPLTDGQVCRLDIASSLLKYSDDELRNDRGRWTTGANAASATPQKPNVAFEPSLPQVVLGGAADAGTAGLAAWARAAAGPLLARLGAVLAAPIAFAAGVLIPTNGSNVHGGPVPGHPDISYHSDEGVLTIYTRDPDGTYHDLYRGFPDIDGLYHDDQGNVIGREVGSAIMLHSDLPLFGGKPDDAAQVSGDGKAQPTTGVTGRSDNRDACPDPILENINGRSARTIAYQSQITGLMPLFDMPYGGVRFDGCDEITLRMLEAKGLGTEWLTNLPLDNPRRIKFYNDTIEQAQRQNAAAADRGVDWHFADPEQADYFRQDFKNRHFDNIRVYYTEAIIKKLDDCLIWLNFLLKEALEDRKNSDLINMTGEYP